MTEPAFPPPSTPYVTDEAAILYDVRELLAELVDVAERIALAMGAPKPRRCSGPDTHPGVPASACVDCSP